MAEALWKWRAARPEHNYNVHRRLPARLRGGQPIHAAVALSASNQSKICVTIGRGRHRHLGAELAHLAKEGVQLVELRLDYIRGEINLRRLLPERACPVIVTVRRPQDGGRFGGSEEDRLVVLRTAIADGVEYVDLEEDVARRIPRYGKTRRIISHHDFRKTPDDLDDIHARLAACDADVVKIATLANHPYDAIRMLRLVRESKIPTVGLCMGEMGTFSRILGGRCGAPFTFAAFHPDRDFAPGQLSFRQMREVYRYELLNAETQVYGVIGDPIAHSYSPLVHNAAFAALGLNKVYVPFRVPREALAQFLDHARELGLQGLSVTIPHKEAVVNRLTQLDGAVKGVNAANTIVYEDYEVCGYNTDYRAAMDSLSQLLPDGQTMLKHKTALVLGAGGAARAIAHGLQRRGAEVVIASRTRQRADKLAEVLHAKVVDWDDRHSFNADLLINCTPVGMHPNVDEMPYEKHFLRPNMIVFDTVYNPENTLLVKEAQTRSCDVITGVDMFVGQAALQFKLFTGEEPPMNVMRDTLKRATGAVNYDAS